MLGDIKVEVFGIRNQEFGCNCNGNQNSLKTMGELYEELTAFVRKNMKTDDIKFQFIDILMDDMDDYQFVIDAMNQGLNLPLTAINGQIKFYNGLANKLITRSLLNLSQQK